VSLRAGGAQRTYAELCEALNDRPMRSYGGKTRRQLFDELDRPYLRPLPTEPFVYATWKQVRVNIDYHVEIERPPGRSGHLARGLRQSEARPAACARTAHTNGAQPMDPRSRHPPQPPATAIPRALPTAQPPAAAHPRDLLPTGLSPTVPVEARAAASLAPGAALPGDRVRRRPAPTPLPRCRPLGPGSGKPMGALAAASARARHR
jgi:hypothetical protein